jgi:hypothetical protein
MKPSQRRAIFAPIPGRPGMKRFVGFEGDPGTVPPRTISQAGRTRPRHNAMSGYRGLGGLGGSNASDRGAQSFPTPEGTAGAAYGQGVYDESGMWGTNDPAAMVSAPIDPSLAMPPIEGPQQIDTGLSIPFGVSVVPWRNPTTMQSVPILASTPVNTPVLSLNMARNALVIQNNSTATAPDVAPNFYIGFNAQPQQGLALTLAPGAGLLFDIITPRDAIYVLIAGGTGATQVIQGVVVQGTYAPI